MGIFSTSLLSISKKIQSYTEKRPWGSFTEFTHEQKSTVKILRIAPGEAFSLQSHKKRDEFWKVLSGDGFITLGDGGVEGAHGPDTRRAITAEAEYNIPRGTNHRIEAGETEVVILEISQGVFDEKDIKRLEDKYGRS